MLAERPALWAALHPSTVAWITGLLAWSRRYPAQPPRRCRQLNGGGRGGATSSRRFSNDPVGMTTSPSTPGAVVSVSRQRYSSSWSPSDRVDGCIPAPTCPSDIATTIRSSSGSPSQQQHRVLAASRCRPTPRPEHVRMATPIQPGGSGVASGRAVPQSERVVGPCGNRPAPQPRVPWSLPTAVAAFRWWRPTGDSRASKQ